MGRRGIAPTDDARWVFNRLVADYAARPAYPEPLVARLAELAASATEAATEAGTATDAEGPRESGGPGRERTAPSRRAAPRVADLGAGVGHLALPLAARGLRVVAVEPARAMLGALADAARAAGLAVEAVHAAAEATGLAASSVELAVIADAAQWIDPGPGGGELARILRPGGVVAVVEARLASTPFLQELQSLLGSANFKAGRRPAGEPAAPRAAQLLAVAGARAQPAERFHHDEPLAPERLDAVLRSLSFLGPALGPAARDAALARARAIAERHGGARWSRELTLTWGHVRRRAFRGETR